MGNIVLLRMVIFVYIVLCAVFLVSPYISGKGKRFGVRIEKGFVTIRGICIFYTVFTLFSSLVFSLVSISKNSFVFANVITVFYIVFMSVIYLKTKEKIKKQFDCNIFREIIINNPPSEYILKGINPFLYFIYFVPVIFSYFIGRNDDFIFGIAGIQLLILILSYVLNIVVCKFKNFVEEDVEKSVKNNIKYRKMWNTNGFIMLLAISVSISVMYAEYKNLLYIGGLSQWILFLIIAVAVVVMVCCSVMYYKK